MSRRRVARRPPAPTAGRDRQTEREAIALRIHQIAATAAMLAEMTARLDDHGPPLSHTLYLIEATLLEVEERVERLAQGRLARG